MRGGVALFRIRGTVTDVLYVTVYVGAPVFSDVGVLQTRDVQYLDPRKRVTVWNVRFFRSLTAPVFYNPWSDPISDPISIQSHQALVGLDHELTLNLNQFLVHLNQVLVELRDLMLRKSTKTWRRIPFFRVVGDMEMT